LGTLLAVLILLSLLKLHKMPLSAIGLQGELTAKGAIYGIIAAFLGLALYPVVDAGFALVSGKPQGLAVGVTADRTVRDWVLVALCTVVAAPVLEEILFRGYVLTTLLARTQNALVALTLAGAIFASVHTAFGPVTVVYIFFKSFLYGGLYMLFHNLYPSMVMHAVSNVVTFLVIPFLVRSGALKGPF